MRTLMVLFSIVVFAGCSQICEFGRGGTNTGLKCHSIFAKAKIGMTKKEVENTLGSPQKRRLEVVRRNVLYDEVWVYASDPPTVLYFQNGILKDLEYKE